MPKRVFSGPDIESLKKKRISELSPEEIELISRQYDEEEFDVDYNSTFAIPELKKLENSNLLLRPWNQIFQGNLCIGEVHEHIAAKKFLVQNMKVFADSGFQVIFMEHLLRDEHQEMVDSYLAGNPIPRKLADYLDELNDGFMEEDFAADAQYEQYVKEKECYNFATILEAARLHKVRVICAEESKVHYKHDDLARGKNRMAVFNNHLKKLVEEYSREYEQKGEKLKWVALVGNAHVNTYSNVPGICEITDAQDLVILDANKNRKEVTIQSEKKASYVIDNRDDKPQQFQASILLVRKLGSDMTYDEKLGEVSAETTLPTLPKKPKAVIYENPFKDRGSPKSPSAVIDYVGSDGAFLVTKNNKNRE